IIIKCERALAKWKQRHLSFGGRATLIQSVLTFIPIYFLSFFRIPKKVVDKLVRVQKRFLWGGGPDNNKIAWIKWETVCLPKEKGGLGIKDINTFNLAL
ncbi:Putative ribonuclease H protein, partial [Glycine soja]